MLTGNIDIIPSTQIDGAKWDACIHSSTTNLIYATKIYLDNMADNWHGIIINDYEAVMPVAWRKKAGIRYCYDVPFVQQLGWFGKVAVDNLLLLDHLFNFCSYGDYNFHFNSTMKEEKNFILRTNFILDLSSASNNITSKYSNGLTDKLKKASKVPLNYKHAHWQKAVETYQQLYSQRVAHVTAKDYNNFINLCKALEKQQKVFARGVIDDASNEMLSVALFFKDADRIYNMINATNNAGKKKEANVLLLNNVINEFAGSGLIFDFEGSDIPGVKSFYQKFGAVNQPYHHLHFNHLPVALKWLKR